MCGSGILYLVLIEEPLQLRLELKVFWTGDGKGTAYLNIGVTLLHASVLLEDALLNVHGNSEAEPVAANEVLELIFLEFAHGSVCGLMCEGELLGLQMSYHE